MHSYNFNKIRNLFLIDRNVTFLNHGSFGSCPKPIFKEYIEYQNLLESQPVSFLVENIDKNILRAQISLSKYVKCNPDDIVFFSNPTMAINEVMRTINLNKGDEILSSTHEYGALDKAWNFICDKKGAKYVKAKIPHPIGSQKEFIDSFLSSLTSKTKAIFISQITSSTGLIFPVKDIINAARKKNILTIIDGAHTPGHINLDLKSLNPDFFTGTCHKWLLCPKGTSFLYVKKEIQNLIEPLIVSWGYNNPEYNRTPFQNSHLWQGTQDISRYLTIESAIKFRDVYNWKLVSKRCRKMILEFREELLKKFDIQPLFLGDPKKWLGQMLSFKISNDIDKCKDIKSKLIHKHGIEIPVFIWNEELYLRVSLNGYNSYNDIEKLLKILPEFID